MDLDFTDDISSITEPSLLEADIHMEEMLDIRNLQIIDMYNFYLVDEMPYALCIGMLRDSFFATWRTLPFGERVMADYIKFCQDKTVSFPNYWIDMAFKQTR